MKNNCFLFTLTLLLFMTPFVSFGDIQKGEEVFATELKNSIPKDRIVPIDALYKKWLEIEAGKSKAVIVDIRTHDEFDSGHIKNASNIDSGHAYNIPKIWPNPEAEIWVLCRTKNRAIYFVGMLYKYGYKNIYLAKGGIQSWAEKEYPLVSEYLGEIKVINYEKRLQEQYHYREVHSH